MPFDWYEFLTIARELAVKESGERGWRSAISRAYYAAFHKARLAVQGQPADRGPDGSHEKVWKVFEQSPDPRRRSIAIRGFGLKEQRVRADYRPNAITLTDALQAIEQAAGVINALARLREDASRL